MPFKSEAQRKYLWANEPEIARDWTDEYGSGIKAAQGGRIGFQYGSPAEDRSRSLAGTHAAENRAAGRNIPDRGGDNLNQLVALPPPPEKELKGDGIIQSIKNFPDNFRRRSLKRNLDYYMGGKKLDFPVWAGIFKGPQEEDDYYTQFAGKSPLELKAQYGNVLDDEEIARVQQMSGVIGQPKVTQGEWEDAFYGPKGPPQPDTGGGGEGG